jgi:hypothetical protein
MYEDRDGANGMILEECETVGLGHARGVYLWK